MNREVDIERDLPQYCAYVDVLLSSALKTGRCAKILRSFMIAYAAGIVQEVNDGSHHIFEPEAICETIRVVESNGHGDFTKGPFKYDKGSLAGLTRKHFFQSSFLIGNIQNEINREGEGIIFRKLANYYGPGNFIGKRYEEIDIRLITEAILHDTIERRAKRRAKNRDGGLTGEHLLYAELPTGNIYLYAAFHGENPDRIAECIRVSLRDFPELAGVAPVFRA